MVGVICDIFLVHKSVTTNSTAFIYYCLGTAYIVNRHWPVHPLIQTTTNRFLVNIIYYAQLVQSQLLLKGGFSCAPWGDWSHIIPGVCVGKFDLSSPDFNVSFRAGFCNFKSISISNFTFHSKPIN